MSTIEARLTERAKAARNACYGAPKIVNIARQAPQIDPDTPIGFVKLQCAKHKISYAQLISKTRLKETVAARLSIVKATDERFPKVTTALLAEIFHREPKAILQATGRKRIKRTNPDKLRAKALYEEGETLANIAEALGCAINTVKNMRAKERWSRRVPVSKQQAAE